MRALLDANVYISYLLNRKRASPPVLLIAAAFSKSYALVLTEHVIVEVVEKTQSKPYLISQISRSEVMELIDQLRIVAEFIPELNPPLPEIGRDRKDDYLFAHAVAGEADFLVSGDRGVRGIEMIGDVRIVTPAEFVAILNARDQQP